MNKIAAGALGCDCDSVLDPRFGRAAHFVIYDTAAKTWCSVDNKQNVEAAQGAGIQSASNVVNAGCDTLICGHCGPKAFTVLTRANVKVYRKAGGTVREAVEAYMRGELAQMDTADVASHWV